MKNSVLYIACMAAVLLTACYEDEGNYVYDESVKDISVSLNEMYGIKKSDGVMTFTINPEIKTDDGDKSYLKYAWTMTTSNANTKGDTVSTNESLTITMDPGDPKFAYKYFLRLYVENLKTNTTTMVPTELQVIKPYSDSWIVMHDVDGHAELGAVEYLGNDALVTPDAYSRETGAALTGKSVALGVRQWRLDSYLISYWGYTSQSELFVATTNHEESGLLNQVDHFKRMANWYELTDQGEQSLLDFNDITFAPINNSGMFFCSNGRVAGGAYYSPFCFLMRKAENLFDDYYISKAVGGPHTGIGFDRLGHRFLHLAAQQGDYWYGYIPGTGYKSGLIEPMPYNEENKADPSAIDPKEEVIAMFPGYKYSNQYPAKWQKYNVYAYAITPGGKSHVYVFRSYALTHAGDVQVSGSFVFPTPQGINNDTPMTSSLVYNNIIFYAVNNRVYKLDITSGQTSLIWQSDDADAKVACLKMAIEGFNGWGIDDNPNYGVEVYGHPYCRCLGVGVNTSDGKGEFVVLQLNTAGKVDSDRKHPSVQIYKGFGPIKSAVFI